MKLIPILCSLAFLSACSSQSIMPDQEGVKVSRKAADKDDCKELGKVTGSSISREADKKEVLANLKQEAANKGANYVVIKQWSATGTSVTGLAYQCN